MKRLYIIAVLLVLGTYEMHAQYGGMYGRGQGYGYGRRSSLPSAGPSQPEPEEPKPSEIVEDRLPDYQAEFDLDAFQTEVLRNTLEDYYIKLISLQKDKSGDAESMRKSFEKAQEDLKVKLGGILNKSEVERLVSMDFSPKARKKRLKKRENN